MLDAPSPRVQRTKEGVVFLLLSGAIGAVLNKCAQSSKSDDEERGNAAAGRGVQSNGECGA